MSFMSFDIKECIRQKLHRSYLGIMTVRMTIPAGETVRVALVVPENEVWFLVGDVHDVPVGIFQHGCRKDDFTAFEPMLIRSDNMVITYAIPFIVQHNLEGTFINTSAADEDFNLSVFYAHIEKDFHNLLKAEIEFEEEVSKLTRAAWGELTEAAKKEVVKSWLKVAPEKILELVGIRC